MPFAPQELRTYFITTVTANRRRLFQVEQNANLALEVSHYGYVLETGRIILHDRCGALRQNENVKAAYLGGA